MAKGEAQGRADGKAGLSSRPKHVEGRRGILHSIQVIRGPGVRKDPCSSFTLLVLRLPQRLACKGSQGRVVEQLVSQIPTGSSHVG